MMKLMVNGVTSGVNGQPLLSARRTWSTWCNAAKARTISSICSPRLRCARWRLAPWLVVGGSTVMATHRSDGPQLVAGACPRRWGQLLAAGAIAATAGSGQVGIVGALLLLGVGWNAGLIGGSALLRDASVSPSLRTPRRGARRARRGRRRGGGCQRRWAAAGHRRLGAARPGRSRTLPGGPRRRLPA